MLIQNKGNDQKGISVKGLRKSFRTGTVCTEVLRGLDLEMAPGAFYAIMGSSGCGKSTLLNILCGLERADEGICTVNGNQIQQMKPQELACYRNREIGIVFQGFYLDETRNLIDNVSMPCGYAGISAKERKRRAKYLLETFGLAAQQKKRPSQISGGQQQRAAIARALINRPGILFADEPTGNLDEENTELVMQLFAKLNRDGMGILLVTHDAAVASYAQKILIMEEGRIRETVKMKTE